MFLCILITSLLVVFLYALLFYLNAKIGRRAPLPTALKCSFMETNKDDSWKLVN